MNNNKIWKVSPAYRLVDPDDENQVVDGDDEYDDVEDSTELDSQFEKPRSDLLNLSVDEHFESVIPLNLHFRKEHLIRIQPTTSTISIF